MPMKTGSRGYVRGTLLCAALSLATTGVGQAAQLLLGEDYQESSNTTSNAPPTAGACNAITYCYIEFKAVPAGKELVVTHVGCSINNSAGNVIQIYLAARKGVTAVERFSFLESSKWPSNMPGSTILVNTQVKQLYKAAERPEIFINYTVAANTVATCTIAGVLRDAPV